MKSTGAVWVVIHMAHSEQRSEIILDLLTKEGFMITVRPVSRTLSAGDACYEVLALASEAKEARDFLQEAGF